MYLGAGKATPNKAPGSKSSLVQLTGKMLPEAFYLDYLNVANVVEVEQTHNQSKHVEAQCILRQANGVREGIDHKQPHNHVIMACQRTINEAATNVTC